MAKNDEHFWVPQAKKSVEKKRKDLPSRSEAAGQYPKLEKTMPSGQVVATLEFNRLPLKATLFGGSKLMQICGDFEGFPL